MLSALKQALWEELEAKKPLRRFRSGWISGVLALFLGLAGLAGVLCLRYPELLTTPELRAALNVSIINTLLYIVFIVAFLLALISLLLRQNKLLGFSALAVTLAAITMASYFAQHPNTASQHAPVYFGLDWFVLNLTLTGLLFLPLERLFRRCEQSVFRFEWREDLLYFLISSVMVQSLTFLSMLPSTLIAANTSLTSVQTFFANLPFLVALLAVMLFTDLVQYWVHRLFHQIPFLWRFHAVHHSAQTLDWLAGSRMHIIEIIVLRGLTVIPMSVLGFEQAVIYSYLLLVYLYSTYIHANVRFDIEWLKPIIVTPRYHHWHHGIEKEAIDVNFAIHFPFIDRLFGTYYMPKGQWPTGYGVGGHPVPSGYIRQFLYPFTKR